MPADIAAARGAQNRVGDCMAHDVRVRMAESAAIGRNGHAAEHERPARHEPMQVVAGARPAAGLRRLVREREAFSRAAPRDRFGNHEILGRRDLDIRSFTFDQPDPMSRPLGKRRFVGRVDVVTGPRSERDLEDVAPEGLRCLRQEDRFARQRFVDVLLRQSRSWPAFDIGPGSPEPPGP